MKKALFAGVAAAAFVATAPSIAQNAPVAAPAAVPAAAPAPMAREHTRDEVVAKVREHFAKLDANRDGFIAKAEAEAGREKVKAKFAENRVERKEHRQERSELRREHTFERLDSNNDGSISRAEFDTAHAQRDGRKARRAVEGAHRGRMLHGMMRGGMHAMHGRMFEMADLNKDGRITHEERIRRHQQVRTERRPG